MRQALLAFLCLSTFAVAQSVLAIAPAPERPREPSMQAMPPTGPSFVAAPNHSEQDAPPVGSTALLVSGLVGLTVAGGRRQQPLRASS